MKLYKRTYAEYYGTDALRFPVTPLPPHDVPYKTPLIAVKTHDVWEHFLLHDIADRVDDTGQWTTSTGGHELTFRYEAEPATAWVTTATGAQPPVACAFWFAWYACATAQP